MSKLLPFVRRSLIPFGWLFGQVARVRRWLYAQHILKSSHTDIPVICVGNLAVGGTGKTPHVTYLSEMLSEQCNVAMLSRGYGRKTKGYILANEKAPEQLTAELIGDEPLLMHLRFPELPLAVDGDRYEGICNLRNYAPKTDVVLMDDAFQHLNFTPSFRIILTEYERPYFRDYPMPAGRLREFPEAVSIADVVIVTKTNVPLENIDKEQWRKDLRLKSHQPLFFTHYTYIDPIPVTKKAQNITLNDVTEVVALTGIAQPQPFLERILLHHPIYHHIKYQDHHNYTEVEIQQMYKRFFADNPENRVILTTEKDWMRLQTESVKKAVSLLPIFVVPVEVEFLFDAEKDNFKKIIEDHVRRKEK